MDVVYLTLIGFKRRGLHKSNHKPEVRALKLRSTLSLCPQPAWQYQDVYAQRDFRTLVPFLVLCAAVESGPMTHKL